MSVDLPEVPEDAPPAVLFRLSYRTDNTARGGYRDSDSEARVVDAMRGWWELNPEDIQALNIKYAVAFHDGVTRAVAEIGEWKWAELPSGVHLGLEVSDPGRPIIDDAWKSARRPRWAFELKSRRPAADRRYPRDGGPPDYVRQAWFGERGQTMPPRLRDTLVSLWPVSPSDSPRDLVGKALELLGEGMAPHMRSVFGSENGGDCKDWLYELRQAHGLMQAGVSGSPNDPYTYIRALLTDNESHHFDQAFNGISRSDVEQLRDARNRWAHFDEVDAIQASQDVRAMRMLLLDLGATAPARRMAQIQSTLDLMVRSRLNERGPTIRAMVRVDRPHTQLDRATDSAEDV